MVTSELKHESVFIRELRIPPAMTLVFVPWLAVVLFTGGVWAALNFLFYALLVLAVGYGIIAAIQNSPPFAEAFVLAPAVGILAISSLAAFSARMGISVFWTPFLWFALAVVGAVCLWSDRQYWTKTTIAYGKSLAVLSLLICAVFFLPGARKDAVLQHDGNFNWFYADTQYLYSMVASIKGDSPPNDPGTVTMPLFYHFAPYAPAAAISRFDNLDLGDAYSRVTRGASIWALILSCFGLGTLLSQKATGEKFGGFMSVAGLFFYGALLSLFTDERHGASYVTGAILFKIPEIDVVADGGPFSHLILGQSVLHGMVAITSVMGLCLIQSERAAVRNWRAFILLALPALAVPVDSVAALYCIGIVGILLFWEHLRAIRSWLLIVPMLGLFLGTWKIMGLSHSTDAALMTINRDPGGYWWTLVVWFIVGLGFRILGFRWITDPLRDPLSALVLASVLGLLSFNLLLKFPRGEERYGIYFLQCIFSIFAFSRLRYGCWRGVERARWIAEWLKPAKTGMIFMIACGALIGCVAAVTRHHTGITNFGRKLPLAISLLLLLVCLSALMKRSERFSAVSSAILVGVLLFGFTAWIAPWFNFGLGRMKLDVSLTSGEVRALKRLSVLAKPNDLFATNKHSLESLPDGTGRSYGYAALAERPVLLEGYFYHSETAQLGFDGLLRDNDLMFTSTDPSTVRGIARKWSVRWLVARSGTDIALSRPLPSWLVECHDCGELKIYRVDQPSGSTDTR